jgi:hypothetical protein
MRDTPRGYEELKAFAEAHGYPVKALLVLGRDNDPFYAGAPSHRKPAEWFAALWQKFGCRPGTHLRRLHYVLISQKEPVLMWDGESPTPIADRASRRGLRC